MDNLPLNDDTPETLCQYLVDNQFYELHVCYASFVAQEVGDLSLTQGDIIIALKQINEHWLQGQVCYDSQANKWPKLELGQQVGTFPMNHCWQVDSRLVETFCRDKLEPKQKLGLNSSKLPSPLPPPQPPQSIQSNEINWVIPATPRKPLLSAAHSSSLSSGSSSLYSTDFHRHNYYPSNNYQNNLNQNIKCDTQDNIVSVQPPPRPKQLPKQLSASQKAASEQAVSKQSGLFSSKQHDKLKGWLQTVRKKTARLSTKITASLGLISLTRDEEFERHFENFKHLEKTIRVFIKNLSLFVEHFESFLLALQNTSEHLADFYRDKYHQKELMELRIKNKALACEHFHSFKRTVDRQVIAVASQLLLKFTGPRQLINKRSTKLLDYDTKAKEMESCRDSEKRSALRDQFVIAKELYDRINGQLIEELPQFNQFALDIFRECILVLLESRRTLILSYTKQTASLLETPLMGSYTASDVASTILMSGRENASNHDGVTQKHLPESKSDDLRTILDSDKVSSRQASDRGIQQGSSSAFGDDHLSRPHSVASQLSSEFDQKMALAAREISSTPLSHVTLGSQNGVEPIGGEHSIVRFVDEPDGVPHDDNANDGISDNQQNEDIEAATASAVTRDKIIMNARDKEEEEIIDKKQLHNSQQHLGKTNKNNSRTKRKRRYSIYTAVWPFVATGPNQLTITCNQQLKLVKACDECGNADWSLVKDKKGQLGYVPTSYIKAKEGF